MKNTKYTFYWTAHEDKGVLKNNYNDEADYVICGHGYTFKDYLSDNHGILTEQEGNSYYVLDDNGERTGECYLVVSGEETDEDAE